MNGSELCNVVTVSKTEKKNYQRKREGSSISLVSFIKTLLFLGRFRDACISEVVKRLRSTVYVEFEGMDKVGEADAAF